MRKSVPSVSSRPEFEVPAEKNRLREAARRAYGDGTMQPEARYGQTAAALSQPLAVLLRCSPETSSLLNDAARCIDLDAGGTFFRQAQCCQGLYLIVSGLLLRRTERKAARLVLGRARAGDLVELAAALGDGVHTYTLVAQTPASALLLPIEALRKAFELHPPLRMQLLEELAREVSRGYEASRQDHMAKTRSRGAGAPVA
jgi:CRP-like cAMP-binding protein